MYDVNYNTIRETGYVYIEVYFADIWIGLKTKYKFIVSAEDMVSKMKYYSHSFSKM